MEIVTAASLCGCWNVHCWAGEDTGLNTWNRESAGVMLSHLQQSNFGDVSLRNLCELEKRHARRKAMKEIKRAYAAQQRWPGMAARERVIASSTHISSSSAGMKRCMMVDAARTMARLYMYMYMYGYERHTCDVGSHSNTTIDVDESKSSKRDGRIFACNFRISNQ